MNVLHEPSAEQHPEWSYLQDDLGVLYCLGRATAPNEHEAVVTYYQTGSEHSTKQTLEGDIEYRRFIYQGLPEERERLVSVERSVVAERLLEHTARTETGIFLDRATLTPGDPRFRELATWLGADHLKASAFQSALQIACTALLKAEVTIDELSLYGAASFGLVATTDKIVDDVDVVFRTSNIPELRHAIDKLQTAFTWADIDPYSRLPERRQQLKAKRWATSQIRLDDPYPLSIDLKVGRQPGAPTLWEDMPVHSQKQRYSGDLLVLDDTEAFCTSPALRCEDKAGRERTLLLEGYQYIGCAVAGDVIRVDGSSYEDSPVVVVTQSERDRVTPDFRNVPVS
jgi:hypothetical protein